MRTFSLSLTLDYLAQVSGEARKCISVIDLLVQVFYVLAVLAVISLFACTIPIWLVVLVAVLFLG